MGTDKIESVPLPPNLQGDTQSEASLDATATTRIASVACRYPTAHNGATGSAASCGGVCVGPASFWAALAAADNLQTVVPVSRWDIDAVYAPGSTVK